MAIKPPDLLNRIPSVADLLEKPPIRALVDRWNRSVVAGGVKSFLDELGSDLQRRAAEANLPSIRDLAERAARYVVTRQHHALGVAINATGQLVGFAMEQSAAVRSRLGASIRNRPRICSHCQAADNSPPKPRGALVPSHRCTFGCGRSWVCWGDVARARGPCRRSRSAGRPGRGRRHRHERLASQIGRSGKGDAHGSWHDKFRAGRRLRGSRVAANGCDSHGQFRHVPRRRANGRRRAG